MTRSVQELIVGLALLGFSVIAFVSVQTGSDSAFESARQAAMTSKTWPSILAIGLGLLSMLFSMGALRRILVNRGEETKSVIGLLCSRTTLSTVGVVILLLCYAYLLREVHFGLLNFGFLFISFFLFGQRKIIRNAVVAAISTAVFYGLFVLVLELPLNP